MSQFRILAIVSAVCLPLFGVSGASGLDPAVREAPRTQERRKPPIVERCGVTPSPAQAEAAAEPAPVGGMCAEPEASTDQRLAPEPPASPRPAPRDAHVAYRRWEQARGPTAWQQRQARLVSQVRAVGSRPHE